MKNFKIIFCWTLKCPAIILYNGEEVLVNRNGEVIVKAEDAKDVITRMKGTNTKTLSSINTIKCLQ